MKMEDLLTHVIAISNNFPEIEKAAQEAVGNSVFSLLESIILKLMIVILVSDYF